MCLEGKHEADTCGRSHALVKEILIIAERCHVDREPPVGSNDAANVINDVTCLFRHAGYLQSHSVLLRDKRGGRADD